MEKKVTLSILTYYDDKLKKWTLNKVEEVNNSIPTVLSQLVNDTNFIDNTVADLVNYYTKNEIDSKLAEGGIGIKIVQVDVRPETGEANTIYLVNAQEPSAEHTYDKYLYVNGKWEIFGSSVNLTDYLKKDEADKLYAKISDISNFVEKTITNEDGTKALIFNETDGGGAKFEGTDFDSFVGVNNGSDDIDAIMYTIDKTTREGSKLISNKDGMFYIKGRSNATTPEDELLTKKDAYTKSEADEKFLTEHQDLSAYATNAGVDNKLENYYDKTTSDERYIDKDYTYSKADVDKKLAEAAAGGEISLDGYLKTEDADKKYATKENLDSYVEERVVGNKGVAVVSNDPTGGIMKFTSNTGEEMGVAVNDGSEGIYTQMYAKDAETGAGTRLTLDKEHAYVRTGNDHTFSSDDVIITKKDLPDTSEFITEETVNSKLENYYDKNTADSTFLKEHQSLDGYAKTEDVAKEYATKTEIENFVDEATVDSKLENYVDKTTADETYAKATDIKDFVTEDTIDTKLEDYVTNEALDAKGYLTEHQDISQLATKQEVNEFKQTAESTYAKTEEVYSKTDADDKFITNQAATAALENKVDKEEGKQLSQENFTTELKNKLDSLENADLTDYYNKSEVDTKIPDVSEYITKAVTDLVNYYTKQETYTQEEVNRLIAQVKATSFKTVQQLPEEDIQPNIIYLLELEKTEDKNKYAEYIYVDSAWEKLGDLTSNIDLSSLEAKIALKANAADVYTKLEADGLFAKIEDIPTTLPNPHKLTLIFNGEEFVVYDGSEDINKDIDIDVSAIPGLDEEIERLIAEHGTTEGFQPFESGKGVWEIKDAAYVINGNNQTIKFTNYDNTTVNNGAYLYITSDAVYKYFLLIKNRETYFNVEYGRVNSDGSAGEHKTFSIESIEDLPDIRKSLTLEII